MADDLLLQFIRYGENSDGHCGCHSCPEDSIDLMGFEGEHCSHTGAPKVISRPIATIYLHMCR